jgi:small GTP-binding protein
LDFLPLAKVPSSQNLQVPLFFHQGTFSKIAAYEFTTLTCIPGVLQYKGSKIQLLDLPGIIEGAAHGKGRGRQVIAVAKSSDLVLMVLDAAKEHEKNHRAILEAELESVGLRLNQQPPNIYFRKKKVGSRSATSTSERRLIVCGSADWGHQIHEHCTANQAWR